MADTYVSEAYAVRHAGSTPVPGTKVIKMLKSECNLRRYPSVVIVNSFLFD